MLFFLLFAPEGQCIDYITRLLCSLASHRSGLGGGGPAGGGGPTSSPSHGPGGTGEKAGLECCSRARMGQSLGGP